MKFWIFLRHQQNSRLLSCNKQTKQAIFFATGEHFTSFFPRNLQKYWRFSRTWSTLFAIFSCPTDEKHVIDEIWDFPATHWWNLQFFGAWSIKFAIFPFSMNKIYDFFLVINRRFSCTDGQFTIFSTYITRKLTPTDKICNFSEADRQNSRLYYAQLCFI